MFQNIGTLMKLKGAWNKFSEGHPKFSRFMDEIIRTGAPEGTVIEIHIEYPDGRKVSSNMRISETDLALIESLKELAEKQK